MNVSAPNAVEDTDETFEQLPIDGSRERPVLVDLWAVSCGASRTLGPILEKVADDDDPYVAEYRRRLSSALC